MKNLKLFVSVLIISAVSSGSLLAYPDLYLNSSDISFSDNSPKSSDVVTISATIHNNGDTYSGPFMEHVTPVYTFALVHNTYWYAQSFIPEEDIKMTGVSMMLYDIGEDDELTVNIQEDNGASHFPSGVSLSTSIINAGGDAETGLTWVDIMFSSTVSLTANTTYWIVSKSSAVYPGFPDYQGYGWTISEFVLYDDGKVAASINQGSSWGEVSTRSLNFKIYRSTQVEVSFYDGDPDSGGTHIDTKLMDTVSSGGTQVVSSTWTPAAEGYRDVYVKIDPGNYLLESSTADNKASAGIYSDSPRVTGAETQDINNNGEIDAYLITFDEAMDISTLVQTSAAGFSVAGYSGLTVSTESLASDRIYLKFTEKGTAGTGTIPEITYSSSTGKFKDKEGHLLLDIDGSDIQESDGTKPKIRADLFLPADNSLGIPVTTSINIVFAEQMRENLTAQAVELYAVEDNESNSILQVPLQMSYTATYDTVTYLHSFVFQPAESLKNNYRYTVAVSTSGEDILGNHPEEASITFQTIISDSQTNTIKSTDGSFKVTLQPDTMKEDYYVTISTFIEIGSSSFSKISSANSKMQLDNDPFSFPINNTFVDIKAFDSSGTEIKSSFSRKVEVVVSYDDTDNDGNVDNTSPLLPEEVLKMYWLDEVNNLWVKVAGSAVETEDNIVRADMDHFTVFALMGSGIADLSDAYAFPVPYLPSQHSKITFTNLSPVCTVKIFTLNGELIKELDHTGGSQAFWEDIDAGSGVYLYVIKNDKEKKRGKLMIIR